MSQIDPIVFARFMVMDGATRLVEAFSGIPEGPLRESVIHMAETMRATYAASPGAANAADPIAVLNIGAAAVTPPPRAAKALPSPNRKTAEAPKTADPLVRAVELRLQGKFPHEIAEATGLRLGAVYNAIGEARKAGVKLPDIGRAPMGARKVKAPYIKDISEVTGGPQMGSIQRAADARGITPEAYLARRKLALEMALDGRHIREIMAAVSEEKQTLSNWFHIAREAGHPVKYMVDESFVKVVETPTAEVVQMKRPVGRPRKTGVHSTFIVEDRAYQRASGKAKASIEKGARLMGKTVEEYLRLRREVLALSDMGKSPADIVVISGITSKQVSNWRTRAQTAGLLGQRPAKHG